MTNEELEELVLKTKDPMKIASAFSGMDDAQRKALSTFAQSLSRQLETNKTNKQTSPRLLKHIKSRKGQVWEFWHKPDTVNARLAVLAVGPLSAVKKQHLFWRHETGEAMNRILINRKPDWIDDWIAHDLSQEMSSLDFDILWDWMQKGICQQPDHDGYYEAFANYMMSTGVYGRGPDMPISKALKADPKLMEYVWSLFRIESNAFNTNSWFKKGAKDDYETWTEALIKMSEAGDLDRQRLLDASLEGLWADLKQNQLSGFHKFHKALAPTNEERAARQSSYLALLAHSVGHVTKFGLDNVSALEKAKALDADTFLAEVPNVFFHEAKGNAVAAVKLLGRLAKSQPKRVNAVLAVLPEALRHPHPDVQNLALGIFDKNADKIDDAVRENIAAAADYVSASVRVQLAPYLEGGSVSEIDHERVAEIEPDIKSLNARRQKALRIKELSKDGPFTYWPISQNILDHDVLSSLEKLEPIESEDELIAAVSHAIEVIDNPDDIERILDGISRHAGNQSSDFKDKTAPLLVRIKNKAPSENDKGLRYHGNVSTAILDLIFAWLTRKFYKTPDQKFQKHITALIPAALFVREVTLRVSKKQSRPLLTFPTHCGGWIDPVVWVDRLKQFENDNVKLSEREISLSMLRLAPDHRAKALKAADGLTTDIARAARFALGGEERPTAKDKKDYGMWISAARCRDPYGDVSELLSELKIKDNWPGGLQPAEYNWKAYTESRESEYQKQIYHYPRLKISTSVPGVDAKEQNMLSRLKNPLTTEWERIPSATPNYQTRENYYWSSELDAVYLSKWLSHQWPQNPNTAYIIGVESLMKRIDEDGSSWDPNFGYLDGLFQTRRPWLEPGHLLLCVALAGKDADVRGLAIDAMIEGIGKGLLDIDVCASVLVQLAAGGWLKLNRLGDNLMTVAETSKLHAWVVSDTLQKWLQKTDLTQRYIFRMLEVLLEAQASIGIAPSFETQETLRTIKGSSKAAKVAKALVNIKAVSSPTLDAELKNLAINGRI